MSYNTGRAFGGSDQLSFDVAVDNATGFALKAPITPRHTPCHRPLPAKPARGRQSHQYR
ncbi:hypothetical protein [Ketogulonicigenium vulgare]|uniref:hypothetical protein n=1 Tax=Ketogulonicigenium vulgare TaxID=92945 RepID=UPI0012EA635A|nr:hypothetical protein [Ketogulonicigenium vulgare]